MNDSENNEKTRRDVRPGDPPTTRAARKPYKSPELVEYGSVAKLTQGTLSMNADFCGGGFRMNQMCL